MWSTCQWCEMRVWVAPSTHSISDQGYSHHPPRAPETAPEMPLTGHLLLSGRGAIQMTAHGGPAVSPARCHEQGDWREPPDYMVLCSVRLGNTLAGTRRAQATERAELKVLASGCSQPSYRSD